MRSFLWAIVGAALLAACEPTLNWRQVATDDASLTAMLPCKPDRASRDVTFAGEHLSVHMMGCEAGGATFAVSYAEVAGPGEAEKVLSRWRDATLANMQASAPRQSAFVPRGALALPSSVQVVAVGRRADGLPVLAHGAWFARGHQVYHAVVYADKLAPEVAETFFSGLSLP